MILDLLPASSQICLAMTSKHVAKAVQTYNVAKIPTLRVGLILRGLIVPSDDDRKVFLLSLRPLMPAHLRLCESCVIYKDIGSQPDDRWAGWRWETREYWVCPSCADVEHLGFYIGGLQGRHHEKAIGVRKETFRTALRGTLTAGYLA